MPYKITSYQLVKQTVEALDDDYSLPWNTYPCLLWPRSKKTGRGGGYGHARMPGPASNVGRLVLTHRLAYELVFGPLSPNLQAAHRCDVRACFRPIHLFAATGQENTQDMISKGRRFQYRAEGELHGQSKLRECDVREIRRLFASGAKIVQISRLYPSVRHTAISRIINRTRWAHI